MADRKIREIRIEGNIAHVQLTRGYEAVIDASDVGLADKYNWHSKIERRPDGSILAVYATSKVGIGGRKQRTIRLHSIILTTPDGLRTDHIDGDGLNNRRENLRVATIAQNTHNQRRNIANTSGVKGVTWHKKCGKWMARIKAQGIRHHLGFFDSLEDAAAAYSSASATFHGAFGRTD